MLVLIPTAVYYPGQLAHWRLFGRKQSIIELNGLYSLSNSRTPPDGSEGQGQFGINCVFFSCSFNDVFISHRARCSIVKGV